MTSTINLDVGDDPNEIYTFYEPIIDIRSTYCEMVLHEIVSITIDGTIDSTGTGVDWSTSACTTSSLVDPSSCLTRMVDVAHTNSPYTLTFNVDTNINGTTTKFTSPLATIVVVCVATSTTVSSTILEEHLLYSKDESYQYTFLDSNITCDYPSCCTTKIFTIVSDAAGTTVHPLMPIPIFNATADHWYITIPTSSIQIIDYYIKMENEWGNTVVSEKLRADIHFNCLHDIFSFNVIEGNEDGITYTLTDNE